jgi:hypothetical protein
MGECGEPLNDILDRIVDGSQIQRGNSPLPGAIVTTVLYERPSFGKRLQE